MQKYGKGFYFPEKIKIEGSNAKVKKIVNVSTRLKCIKQPNNTKEASLICNCPNLL